MDKNAYFLLMPATNKVSYKLGEIVVRGNVFICFKQNSEIPERAMNTVKFFD